MLCAWLSCLGALVCDYSARFIRFLQQGSCFELLCLFRLHQNKRDTRCGSLYRCKRCYKLLLAAVFCTLRKFTKGKEKRNLCNCYSPPEKILLWVDFSSVSHLCPTIKSRKWASEFCFSYITSPRNLGFEKILIQGAESNIGRSLVVLWPGCRCHTSYTNFLRR